jgi:DNA-binding CsgD family transcriptional regulator
MPKIVKPACLSAKERQCLDFAAQGFSAKETAKILAALKGAIKNYREWIREKLQCKTIAQAVYKAFVK